MTLDVEFPNMEVPEEGSFSAFTVARSDGSDLVNTHIVYIDEAHSVQHVWTDDGVEWQAASPEQLVNLDDGSDIACISMSGGEEGGEAWTQPVFMRTGTHLSRCYYQRGGSLIEAQLQGNNDWVELGEVPMP